MANKKPKTFRLRVVVPKEASDLGSEHLKQHAEVVVESTPEGKRSRVMTASPLDTYFNKGLLSQEEKEGGQLFYADFYYAGMQPSITSQMRPINESAGTGESITERQLQARRRYKEAHESIAGKPGKALGVEVCCYGYYLSDLLKRTSGAFLGYNRHTIMPRFREALSDLSEFYGIPTKK